MGVRYFGAEVLRGEDAALLTGSGRYIDDINLPGTLHGAFVRSPHAHAVIKSIKMDSALAIEGVHAAFTYADLEEPVNQQQVQLHANPLISQDIRPFPLAKDEVCFVGEAIAFVVAASRHIAEDAAQLINVEYDVLEPIVGIRQAMAEGAPTAHTGADNNLVARMDVAYGDVDDVFGCRQPKHYTLGRPGLTQSFSFVRAH